ncbi:FHA domain-containing protein [Actinokineospora sp. PR83]|uniref:FHA domain-containing protein n=1 Tax=Actinokineospora sp. PR83 TaxID=2884908 RepID=UPI001F3747B5|nr:FHA domain-containing protein [Actinokineospora sp. PR83]MCG8915190.1 FHA domain-containing protein [Actinokineospora sp. PR83]
MSFAPVEPIAARSLVLGAARVPPGGLSALTLTGGVTVEPREGHRVRFGRNRPRVEVCVGENDVSVSREHGVLDHRGGRWWVTNTGRSPIRLPASLLLHRDGEPLPLAPGYTPLFLRGSRGREHLVELYVADAAGSQLSPRPNDITQPPKRWRLTEEERLALVVLGQRYLLHDPHPQPLARQQAADQLRELRPAANWTIKRVEHIVAGVRGRLAASGVHGLLREEVGEPVGLTLTVNLLRELISSTTLVPLDLDLVDDPNAP